MGMRDLPSLWQTHLAPQQLEHFKVRRLESRVVFCCCELS